jgi:tRNA modification GTPase
VAHVHGVPLAVDRFLHALCGHVSPRNGALGHRRFGTVDDGVVARVGDRHALVMPHGGVRIRELLDVRARELGAYAAMDAERALHSFPEAADAAERAMLATLARAASPLAVDLLAAQPARWRAAGIEPAAGAEAAHDRMDARERRLMRLVDPPRVVVTGPANAGKSTLLNALAGRAVAIAHHAPGTTRDAVAARIDLAGLVVDWFDTPGVRTGMDEIERAAARLAERALAHADLVVELTAPGLGWHAMAAAPGAERLRVLNQSDRADASECAERAGAALSVSARTGSGMPEFVARVRDALVPPADVSSPLPWRFA